MSFIEELELFCKTKGISKRDMCIVGSYLLEVLNLRKASDIDYILLVDVRKKLGFSKGNIKTTKNTELVSRSWLSSITDDIIISDPQYHTILPNGFKIIKLDLLIQRKSNTQRAKDLKDLDLIKTLLTN